MTDRDPLAILSREALGRLLFAAYAPLNGTTLRWEDLYEERREVHMQAGERLRAGLLLARRERVALEQIAEQG